MGKVKSLVTELGEYGAKKYLEEIREQIKRKKKNGKKWSIWKVWKFSLLSYEKNRIWKR